MASIMDYKPMLNIKPFGRCQSLLNPTVAMATAANFGVLQPLPCIPNTTAPWLQGHSSFTVKGQPALLDNSKLMCAYAGVIEIVDAGQTTVQTGATRVEKEEKKKIQVTDVYWKENDSNEKHYEIFPDYEVTLYIETENYTEGEFLRLNVGNDKEKKFKGDKDKISISGKVDSEGIVCVKKFKIEYDN